VASAWTPPEFAIPHCAQFDTNTPDHRRGRPTAASRRPRSPRWHANAAGHGALLLASARCPSSQTLWTRLAHPRRRCRRLWTARSTSSSRRPRSSCERCFPLAGASSSRTRFRSPGELTPGFASRLLSAGSATQRSAPTSRPAADGRRARNPRIGGVSCLTSLDLLSVLRVSGSAGRVRHRAPLLLWRRGTPA